MVVVELILGVLGFVALALAILVWTWIVIQ